MCFQMRLVPLIIFTLILGCHSAVKGESITLSKAGSLESEIQCPEGIKALTISGPLDESDLTFVRNSMPLLEVLSLAEATITGDNLLPDYSLAGLPARQIDLPATLTSIGTGALAGAAITSITIPPTVTSIAPDAFNGCTQLAKVQGGDGIITIGDRAFSGCTALTAINLPQGLTEIGNRAFALCESLAEVAFPSTLVSLGHEAFIHSALDEVDLSDCRALTSMGDFAFASNKQLTHVVLPEALSVPGQGLFFDCTDLISVAIPDGMSDIPPYMFKGTSSVSTLRLPATLSSIGNRAMAGMESLNEIDGRRLEAVPTTGDNAFGSIDRPAIKLQVKEPIATIMRTTPVWQDFHIISSNETGASTTVSTDDVKINREGSMLHVTSPRDIRAIMLHDMNGRQLSSPVTIDSGRGTIDTAGIATTAIIVTVITDDQHEPVTFKLLLI